MGADEVITGTSWSMNDMLSWQKPTKGYQEVTTQGKQRHKISQELDYGGLPCILTLTTIVRPVIHANEPEGHPARMKCPSNCKWPYKHLTSGPSIS